MEKIRLFRSSLSGLTPTEKMCALGTAAQLLEEKGPITESIAIYEELVTLAVEHDPTDIRTARDWARLANLYARIGETEKEIRALECASHIYGSLDSADKKLLESEELGRIYHCLAQSRAAIALQQGLRKSFETKKSILLRMADILRNDFSILIEHPGVIVQQIHNGLSPFRSSETVHEVLDRMNDYLTHNMRDWCELYEILGPGKDGWLQRQLVTRTYFPDDIRHFAAFPNGCLLAITDTATAWVALPGGPARSVAVQHLPRSGRYAMAHIGDFVAFIDDHNTLRFFEFNNANLVDLGFTHANACLLARSGSRFVASFRDGRVVRFSSDGHPEVTVTDTQLLNADVLFAWEDGSCAVLIQNAQTEAGLRSQLQTVFFEPPHVEPLKELPVDVRSIQYSWDAGTFLIGSMDGLRFWNLEREFPKEREDGSAGHIVRSKEGKYTAMLHNGIWVISHGFALQTMVPPPSGSLAVDQLAFQDSDNGTFLHIAVGNLVETWAMEKLSWRSSITSAWVEKAIFAQDGAELVAVNPDGFRYLWRVEDGKLLEIGNFDPEMRMISWASQKNIGAVCYDTMVEVVDGAQMFLGCFNNDYMPHSVVWDRAGNRFAWAGLFNSTIRWVERTSTGFRRSEISEQENYFPLSPSLSWNGRILAYIRGHHRMPTLPETGISVKMGWTSRRIRGVVASLINEGIALVDLETGLRRVILADNPVIFMNLWFASDDYLIAADDAGCVFVIDIRTTEIVTQCWTVEPVVAGCVVGDTVRLCDTGMSAAFGPVVYDFKVHLKGKASLWH